jgi:hypothetical protein
MHGPAQVDFSQSGQLDSCFRQIVKIVSGIVMGISVTHVVPIVQYSSKSEEVSFVWSL